MLLWCSSKFEQLYKLSLCNKINIQPFLVGNIDNIAPLVVNIYLGLRHRVIFLPLVQYLSKFHKEGWIIINIYIYTYCTSSNLYTPDSVSLASLANNLCKSTRAKVRDI